MGTSDVFKVLQIARAASPIISRNAWAIIQSFIDNILNEIIKESIFGKYFSVKQFVSLSRSSCSYSSSSGLNFLSFAHFPQTFNHVCVDLVVFLFFAFSFSWSTTISSDEANQLSAILLFVFKFCASPIVSIATFISHFLTSTCTL